MFFEKRHLWKKGRPSNIFELEFYSRPFQQISLKEAICLCSPKIKSRNIHCRHFAHREQKESVHLSEKIVKNEKKKHFSEKGRCPQCGSVGMSTGVNKDLKFPLCCAAWDFVGKTKIFSHPHREWRREKKTRERNNNKESTETVAVEN